MNMTWYEAHEAMAAQRMAAQAKHLALRLRLDGFTYPAMIKRADAYAAAHARHARRLMGIEDDANS